MNKTELKRIRKKLGIGVAQFGFALGCAGSLNTSARLVRRYEHGDQDIPDHMADLAQWYERNGLVGGLLKPKFPRVFCDLMVHGDRAAVLAFGREGRRGWEWLFDWSRGSAGNMFQIAMHQPVDQVGIPGPASVNVAHIMAHDVIQSSGRALLGARLTVAAGHDVLREWLQ